jgi:hypothetical protein
MLTHTFDFILKNMSPFEVSFSFLVFNLVIHLFVSQCFASMSSSMGDKKRIGLASYIFTYFSVKGTRQYLYHLTFGN